MVPSERSLVDLSKRETTTLVWVGDVSVVIVEVVEGLADVSIVPAMLATRLTALPPAVLVAMATFKV